MKAHGFTYYSIGTVSDGAGPRHRRGGLHRQSRGPRARATPDMPSSCSTISRRATPRRCRRPCRSCSAAMHDRARWPTALARPPHRRGDALRRLARRRCRFGRAIPLGYYHNNVAGSLALLEAMVGRRRRALRLLVDVRGLRRAGAVPIDETLDTRRSTPTARPSWRSSGRCRISSAPTACAGSRCATSMPPARIPTARSARTTPRRSTSFRGPSRRRPAVRRCRCSARIIRRPTAPACATIFTCATWPTRTCCALARSRAARLGGVQRRHRHAAFGARGHRRRSRAWSGQPVRWEPRARGGPAIRRRSMPSSERMQRELGWRPRYADLDTIVSTPGAGIRRTRAAIDGSSPEPDGRLPAAAPLRRAPPRLIAGAMLAMVVYGAASAAIAWLIKPIIDDVLPSQESAGLRRVGDPASRYLLKGIGAYFSSYLMDDLGPAGRHATPRRPVHATCSISPRPSSPAAPPGSCSRASTTTSGRCSAR